MSADSRTRGRSVLSREEFTALTRPLIGLPVSHTWRGYGSAIFLELGALTTETRTSLKRGEYTATSGEATFMLEWSWRVESPRTIQFGSWSTEGRITRGVASLAGHTLVQLELAGRIPELVLTLDRNRWLHTFMTAEGQPAWYIHLQDDSWLSVRRGHIIRQAPPGLEDGG